MLIIPKVVMMSGIMWPMSILFSAPIARKHGGRTRTRYGPAAAVADHIEAQFAVGAFDRRVGLAGGHLDPFHDELEVIHQPLDGIVDALLGRQRDLRIANHDRARGKLRHRLRDDLLATPRSRGNAC